MKTQKLLIALMLAAGTASIAFGPASAEEKKKVGGSTAEINAQDCKTAGPGDKNKPREKVAAGSAMPAGEVAPGDCKAAPVVKDKSRAAVAADAKAAAKAGATKGGGGPN